MYFKPTDFKLTPILNYEESHTNNGKYIIKINTLGHQEYFTIQLFDYNDYDYSLLSHVRSNAGPGKRINLLPQYMESPKFYDIIGFLAISGIGLWVFVIWKIIVHYLN